MSDDWYFDIVVPGLPPSVNNLYEGMGKNRHKRAEVVAYQAAVYYQLNNMDYALIPDGEKVRVTIAVWVGDKRKRDLDNMLKVLLDTFKGYLYKDDSIIHRILIYRAGFDKLNPRCELWFSVLGK